MITVCGEHSVMYIVKLLCCTPENSGILYPLKKRILKTPVSLKGLWAKGNLPKPLRSELEEFKRARPKMT